MTPLAAELRRHRRAAGYSQAEVARLWTCVTSVGSALAMVREWERDERTPNFSTLARLEGLYRLSYGTLLNLAFPPEMVLNPPVTVEQAVIADDRLNLTEKKAMLAVMKAFRERSGPPEMEPEPGSVPAEPDPNGTPLRS